MTNYDVKFNAFCCGFITGNKDRCTYMYFSVLFSIHALFKAVFVRVEQHEAVSVNDVSRKRYFSGLLWTRFVFYKFCDRYLNSAR